MGNGSTGSPPSATDSRKSAVFFAEIEPAPSWPKKRFFRGKRSSPESNPRHHCWDSSLANYTTWHSWQLDPRSDWDQFVQFHWGDWFILVLAHSHAENTFQYSPFRCRRGDFFWSGFGVRVPPASSRLRGPPRNRKSSGKVFLRCCYTISKATTTA